MTDLVTWLRAQMDTDEQGARAASPGGWTYGDVDSIGGGSLYDESRMIGSLHYEQPTDHDGRIVRHLLEYEADANGRHIAVHDPARVLRQVAAMRKIVDMCLAGIDPQTPVTPGVRAGYRAILTDLAAIYADRDGYGEWRL